MKDVMAWLMTAVFLLLGGGYFLYLPYALWTVHRDFSHMENGWWWRKGIAWKKVSFVTVGAAILLFLGIQAFISLV